MGERLLAEGHVVKPGARSRLRAAKCTPKRRGRRTLVALMQQTLMVMRGKPDA